MIDEHNRPSSLLSRAGTLPRMYISGDESSYGHYLITTRSDKLQETVMKLELYYSMFDGMDSICTVIEYRNVYISRDSLMNLDLDMRYYYAPC